MNNSRFGIVVAVGLVLVGIGLSAFTVNERELAIKLRFGEVRAAQYEPGLQQAAVERLREIIKNSVVTEFGKRSTREAISVERMELMRDMLAKARPTAEGLGVELVDFRVKQVEFVARVRESVYDQMRAERQQLATQTRAEGREAAALIESTAEKERTVIIADANRESQIIRGEGDARSAEIYANAYNKDPEFYAFYRSINAYKRSLGKEGDVLVLDPGNEFFRYLNRSDGKQ